MLLYNSVHAFSAQNNLCFSSKSYCCMSYTNEMYSVLPTLHFKKKQQTALWRCNSPTIQFTHLQWQWFSISFFCFLFLTTGLSVSLFSFFTAVDVVGEAPVWILAPILTRALLSGYACVSHSFFVITQKTGRDPGVLCEEVVIAPHEGHGAKTVYRLHFGGVCSETRKL